MKIFKQNICCIYYCQFLLFCYFSRTHKMQYRYFIFLQYDRVTVDNCITKISRKINICFSALSYSFLDIKGNMRPLSTNNVILFLGDKNISQCFLKQEISQALGSNVCINLCYNFIIFLYLTVFYDHDIRCKLLCQKLVLQIYYFYSIQKAVD